MTKQELQRKIYDAGFEAPMWENSIGDLVVLKPYELGRLLHESPDIKPHYPCEWLWERLPKSVTVADLDYEVHKALDVDYGLTYLVHGGYDSHWTWDSIPKFNVTKNNDLHQALLELFVWTITEGHVKP